MKPLNFSIYPLVLLIIIFSTQCCSSQGSNKIDDISKYASKDFDSIYPQKKIIHVEYIGQNPRYPCGCEGISAVMLLKYHGFEIDTDYFFSSVLDTFPFTYNPYTNTYYGEDMDRFYVGDPCSELGKGCYSPVIKNAIEKVVTEEYIAVVEQGCTVSQLAEKYLKRLDMPILIWATSYMRDSLSGTKWKIERTGEICTFPAYMHCLVLVGYDDENGLYYFNDPYDNLGLVSYTKDLVEEKFKELGSQALALVSRNEYQTYSISVNPNKLYSIRNAETGKYITAYKSADGKHTNLYQNNLLSTEPQQFRFIKNTDGSFCIVSEFYDMALELSNNRIIIGKREEKDNQKFSVTLLDNGFFNIAPINNSTYLLCVSSNFNGNKWSENERDNIHINKDDKHSFYQQWQLIPI